MITTKNLLIVSLGMLLIVPTASQCAADKPDQLTELDQQVITAALASNFTKINALTEQYPDKKLPASVIDRIYIELAKANNMSPAFPMYLCTTKSSKHVMSLDAQKELKHVMATQNAKSLGHEATAPQVPNTGKDKKLIQAICENKLGEVKKWLKAGARTEATDEAGWPALALATRLGDRTSIVNTLIAHRADLDAANSCGITALQTAAAMGDQAITTLLVTAKANLEAPNHTGGTALQGASQAGHTDIVNFLLAAKANPETTNKYGETALLMAAARGHLETVRLLLDNQANPNIKNTRDNTPLILAKYNGHSKVVDLLIARNAVDKTTSTTPNNPAKLNKILDNLLIDAIAKNDLLQCEMAAKKSHGRIIPCPTDPTLRSRLMATCSLNEDMRRILRENKIIFGPELEPSQELSDEIIFSKIQELEANKKNDTTSQKKETIPNKPVTLNAKTAQKNATPKATATNADTYQPKYESKLKTVSANDDIESNDPDEEAQEWKKKFNKEQIKKGSSDAQYVWDNFRDHRLFKEHKSELHDLLPKKHKKTTALAASATLPAVPEVAPEASSKKSKKKKNKKHTSEHQSEHDNYLKQEEPTLAEIAAAVTISAAIKKAPSLAAVLDVPRASSEEDQHENREPYDGEEQDLEWLIAHNHLSPNIKAGINKLKREKEYPYPGIPQDPERILHTLGQYKINKDHNGSCYEATITDQLLMRRLHVNSNSPSTQFFPSKWDQKTMRSKIRDVCSHIDKVEPVDGKQTVVHGWTTNDDQSIKVKIVFDDATGKIINANPIINNGV